MKIVDLSNGKEYQITTSGQRRACQEMFIAGKIQTNLQGTYYTNNPGSTQMVLNLGRHLDIASDISHPEYNFSLKVSTSILDSLLKD